MKKVKEVLLQNAVFLIITVLVILAAFINRYYSCIGDDPFSSGYILENPVQAVFSDNVHYYITDSSYTILAANENDEIIYEIEGGDPENTFDFVDGIAVGNDGTLYVHDRSLDDSGLYAYRERILEFKNNGRSRNVLYEAETLGEDGSQILYLDSPRVIDGKLYFSEIAQDGIYVKCCTYDGVNECAYMPLDDASDLAADSSFDNSFEISALMFNGDVYTYKNGENTLVYNAREHDTDEYCSLVTDIAYGDDGVLYINDMGQRRIIALTDNGSSVAVERGSGKDGSDEHFALSPLYSGLNVSGNIISFLSSEYGIDEELGEPVYYYNISAVDTDGNTVFYSDTLGISPARRAVIIFVYISLLIIGIIGIYALIKLIRTIHENLNIKTQLMVLITAIAVTVGVSRTLFDSYFQKFSDESLANLSNIAYLMDATLDKDVIKSINDPDMYFDESYQKLNEDVMSILESEANKSSNIYVEIYKVYNDVICEVYGTDGHHGVMYPLAGVYSGGSIEETVVEEGICYLSQDFELSEGSYSFALIATYDDSGEPLALIEVGTDYNYFVSENNALYRRILITAGMMVIIIMLLFSELMNGYTAVKERNQAAKKKLPFPPEVVRPVSFMIFFTANITTAFLPIYGMSLWNDKFPVPAEVAAAFPLSAELILSALSALVSGSLIKKFGVKPMCIIGSFFYIGGNLLSAFAGNLWILICANSTCGIGGGMLMIAVNTWITSFEDDESKNKGFLHYNAAYLAGMNCGTVIGSMIWESIGVTAAYITAAAGAFLIAVFSVMMVQNKKAQSGEDISGKRLSLKYFFTGRMIRYIICIAVPYLICASFLSYYFPVVAENNLLSASEISMAFLISGVISIYSGSTIGESVVQRFGVRKTMILSSFIYAAALLYLVINPSITSCYVVIVMFAVADSFGLPAHSIYFISMPEIRKIGESRALGINNTIESIVSAFGSVIFGAALLLGEQRGILLICAVFSALLLLFVLGGKNNEIPEVSSDQ